ncbi:MAG: B12-binding domain-containing radical SAM protein [Thermoguttaceae bacterium]
MNTTVKNLEIVYIVPSRYDDDGYVQRWTYGVVPSHSLAVVSCLTEAMAERKPFGDDVTVHVHCYDDNVERVPFERIVKLHKRSDTRVVVGFVGVQTNQFPRAVDLARQFRQHAIPVLIGGFHVTGVVNLFETLPPDLQQLLDEGISLVCGEAETAGVLESLFGDFLDEDSAVTVHRLLEEEPHTKAQRHKGVLTPQTQDDGNIRSFRFPFFRDFRVLLRAFVPLCEKKELPTNANHARIQNVTGRIYRFPFAPSLDDAPLPTANPKYIDHFGAKWATIDSSRGCPYGCSFCTVINIQGRKMRCRSAETVLKTVRENYARGVVNFFFTDDNFARSKHWREIFDGLIELQREGKKIGFMMQVDTQSYRIADFAAKAKEAGCRSVFVGMESVNPQNIAASNKSQNSVEQYRPMVSHWQELGVMVHVGYIIGFPHDTQESVANDVRFLRDNVGVDLASFFMMTPLPGSVDHLNMVNSAMNGGEAIDPDWNKYDSFHETFSHPQMHAGEWKAATQAAYSEFYSKENIVNILRRTPREHYWLVFWNLIWYRYSGVLSATHPMMTGFFRKKYRTERRPGLPRESVLRFACRRVREFFSDAASYTQLFFEFQEIWFLTRKDPERTLVSYLPTTEWSQRWASLQQKLAWSQLSGRCEDLVTEMRTFLANVSASLHQASEPFAWTFSAKGQRDAESFEAVASEIDAYLATMETASPDLSLVQRTQAFIQDRLAPRYEELTCRYVALRRRVNDWRRDTLRCLREGRIVSSTLNVLTKPWLLFAEAYLSLRFSIAAMRKEM